MTHSSVERLPNSNACERPSASLLSTRLFRLAVSFSFISFRCGSSLSTSRRS